MNVRIATPMPRLSEDCSAFAEQCADAVAKGRHFPTTVAMEWWSDEICRRINESGWGPAAPFDCGYQLGISV